MSRATRRFRSAVFAILIAGCAGPLPSVSPEPGSSVTSTAATSPGNEPSTSPEPSEAPAPTATNPPAPTATLEATDPPYEPDPTPKGAYPLRTEVEINPNVIDRLGVPKDLYDSYWWRAYGTDAGQVGTTAQIGLPAGEWILTVSNGLVVSALYDEGERFGPATLIVREVATGIEIRRVAGLVVDPDAVLIDGRLYWTGIAPGPSDHDTVADGGVWTVRLGDGEPSAIVEPGRLIGSLLAGRRLRVSPSERTFAAVTYGGDEWSDIIDVETQQRIHRVRGIGLNTLTDDTYLSWDSPPTDAPIQGYGMTAYNLTTDEVRWRFPGPGDVDRFLYWNSYPTDSDFVVEYVWGRPFEAEYRVATFDALTGTRHLLLKQDRSATDGEVLHITSVLGSAHIALAVDTYLLGESVAGGNGAVSVLHLDSGELRRAAFVIDPLWMCNDDYCVRD